MFFVIYQVSTSFVDNLDDLFFSQWNMAHSGSCGDYVRFFGAPHKQIQVVATYKKVFFCENKLQAMLLNAKVHLSVVDLVYPISKATHVCHGFLTLEECDRWICKGLRLQQRLV